MKNFIIFVVVILVLIWLKPYFIQAPPADSIDKCFTTATITEGANYNENLTSAEAHYKSCKFALQLIDKKFTDNNWKNMTINELSANGYSTDQIKLNNWRASMKSLNNISMDAIVIASIRYKELKDKKGALTILEEAKSITSSYKSFQEIPGGIPIDTIIQKISAGN